jgi:N,N'-diacetyllegionaminate synthase
MNSLETINKKQPCYLIAEIGVNHGGNTELAKEMIVAAKNSGADAVKFQTFTADTLVSQGTPKVKYQESTTDSQETHYEMIRSLEFKREDHQTIIDFCLKQAIDFISTPYDLESAKFLDSLDVRIFKTASADIVDLPLQEFLASTGKPVIVSTGMATLGEVEQAVNIYREAKNPYLTLLHCVSNYPCAIESLNLRIIETLRSAFQIPVGYSDHSVGCHAAIIAVALGANVIEKHFTLDKNMLGPDHKASSTPLEFKELAVAVRQAESALGSPFKECQEEERQMSQVSRKSVVARDNIRQGETIISEHLIMKRPGTGLPSTQLELLIGKRARKKILRDQLINYWDVER